MEQDYDREVDHAIAWGRVLLIFIPLMIFFCGVGSCFYVVAVLGNPWWWVIILLLLGFVAGMICWAFLATPWRIWAFRNVNDVHLLMDEALFYKLIDPPGGWFEKLEYRTKRQSLAVDEIYARLAQPRRLWDDKTIPDQTIVHYSKTYIIVTIILSLIVLFISIIGALRDSIFFTITAIGSFVMIVFQLIRFKQRKAQLTLSKDGLQFNDGYLIPWHKISQEWIGIKDENRLMLEVTHERGENEANLEKLGITMNRLRYLMKVYRNRSEKYRELMRSGSFPM
jgi:ABC-type multidrug transport system fused ATPase/permease subunit